MNSRPNSPPPSPPGHRGPASASLAQKISPGSSPRSQVTEDRRLPSTGTAKAAQPPVGTAVAAAQAAIIPGAAVSRNQAPAPAPAPAPVSVPSRPTAIRQPPVVPGNYRGQVLAKEAGSTPSSGNTTQHPVKQSPPPVKQNPVPPIGKTVTPEPQIIQSPPTPEEADVQLSNQPATASPPVEPQGDPAKPWVRQPSNSPGRSARFSSQLTAGDLRLHHPPPRSVSPVKSALKHTSHGSLSPDRVPGSIARPGPSSELSDGTSVTSDDGFRPGGAAKRKSAKVSFDDEAEVVGVAASPPTSPEEMLPESPPGRSRSKMTWFGVGKKKPTPFDSADEFDEVLKPRRALPSFGRVRTGRDGDIPEPVPREDPSDNESVTSSASITHDDDAGGNGDVVPGWSFSNDHAIGGVLAQEPSEAPKLAETIDHPPLPSPPQSGDSPTSADLAQVYISELPPGWVEGMHTADYNLAQNQETKPTAAAAAATEETAAAPAPAPAPAESGADAPMVNVASLSSLENGRGSLEGYDVPGNFPRTSLEVDPRSTTKSKRKSRDSTGSGSETVTESGNPTANGTGVDDISDSESFYSDAAEDFDEGDGFGSINAIVGGQAEQTTNQPEMAVDRTRPPPLSTREELPSVPEESQMIGRAVSPPLDAGPHWLPDSPDTVDELLPFSSPYPPFPLKRKPTKPKPPSVKVSRTSTDGPRARRPVSMSGAPTSLPFRQGTTTANGVTIPRDNSSSTITSTGSLPQKMGTDRRRPVSLGPVLPNSGSVRRRQDSPQRPTTSNGIAQSEHRSPESDGTIGHSMRRTLRTTTDNTQNSRTISEDARPTSSGSGTGPMRSTLRGPPPSKGGSKTTFFSTRKAASKSPTRKKLARGPGPLFSSRFDDSDDDGYGADDHAHNFRSRFADSSDEEDRPGKNTLRPVRGIPRRHGKEDGESTELEDSSDDEGRRRTKLGAAAAAGATTTTSTANAAATNKDNNSAAQSGGGLAAVARSRGVSPEELEDFLHHQPSRKLGIFSRFNLRKSKNNEAKQLRKSTPEATTTAAVSPDPIMQHHRGGSVTTTVTANGKEGPKPRRVSKLVNNNHRQKSAEESWPLRSNRKADGDEEEAVATETKTSAPIPDATINDGDEVAKRSTAVEPPGDTSVVPPAPAPAPAPTSPTAGNQLAGEGSHFPKHGKDDDGDNNNNNNNNDNHDSLTSARDVVIAGSGRKKRFPKLRRAFGLR